MVGLDFLAEARAAGLTLASDGDRLVIRGARSCEPLAMKLLEHKRELLDLLKQEESGPQAEPTPDYPASQRSERNLQVKMVQSSDSLDVLRMERDRLSARLDKGSHFLDDLAERVGQESAEYDRYTCTALRLVQC